MSRETVSQGALRTAAGEFEIEFSLDVVEEIRAAAVDGLCRFPRGGIETGGVLFGVVDGLTLRILAHRPVTPSYASGPSFSLSAEDAPAFETALRGPDNPTDRLAPVGWYVSHTRTDLALRPSDIALHERWFSGSPAVALVVHPEPFGSAEAVFNAGENASSLQSSEPFRLRAVPDRASRRRSRSPVNGTGTPRAGIVPETPIVEPAPPRTVFSAEPTLARTLVSEESAVGAAHTEAREPGAAALPAAPPGGKGGGRRWWWGVVAIVVAAAVWLPVSLVRPPSRADSLGLRVFDVDGQLRVTWDHDSRTIRAAKRALLAITDGRDRLELPFGQDRLRLGSVTYARRSTDVEIRLRVDGPDGAPVEESVRLAGPAREQAGENPVPSPAAAAEPPDANLAEAAASFEPEPSASREPQVQKRAAVRSDLPASPPASAGPTDERRPSPGRTQIRTDEPDREPVRRFAGLPQRHEATASLPAPPTLSGNAAPITAETPQVQFPRAVPAPPLPQPAARPAQTPSRAERPAYAGPKSGRLIWIGELPRGGAVSITGGRASAGYLTGELPGVPVRISAHPAKLGNGGLQVYASSPSTAGMPAEPPGPQNGWNRTSYTWESRRAGDVLVTEAPSALNGWRSVSLRGNGNRVSVIVIDWRVAGN